MIRYSLHCENAHEFEGWFSGSVDFDNQLQRGLIGCPVCGSSSVEKMLMAPSVSTARKKDAMRTLALDTAQKQAFAKIKETLATIRANTEDVGDKFAEEARKIHHGEVEQRGIIGQASPQEAVALIEEGIEVAPLPVLPDDVN
ncbi:DUF1178 family protein [Agrobacterium rosae]|uniref:DUF1178 family protein n=1 Tax=Agrobacterium rosae TaxID=1972867 RepID=UPI002A0FAFB7|nr:DUF1178 family protein [Agrobacterium rosae]MDX8312143.1 DUF1178 family protein [Agrobacterium rosae]